MSERELRVLLELQGYKHWSTVVDDQYSKVTAFPALVACIVYPMEFGWQFQRSMDGLHLRKHIRRLDQLDVAVVLELLIDIEAPDD
jgi:hypothetical protein